MSIELEYKISYLGAPNPNKLEKILELRRSELGETTKQAVVAMGIDILKSLRADTKVARKDKADIIKCTDVTSRYKPSLKPHKYSKDGLKNEVVTPCFRIGTDKGRTILPPRDIKIYWDKDKLGMKWRRIKQAHTYHCRDQRFDGKVYEYFVVTTNEKRARDIVLKKVHNVRIEHYKGLAKNALGIAMNKINSALKVSDNVTPNVARTNLNNIKVELNDSGGQFGDRGECSLYVHDALMYAGQALKNGVGYIKEAENKAINKVAGRIIQKWKQAGKIDESIKLTADDLLNGNY